MPLGLGLVFTGHYRDNNWMTKTKQLIFRGKQGKCRPLQVHLPPLELLCWVIGTEATGGTGFSDPLTTEGSEEIRDIFWWLSHSTGLIPRVCFADFVSTVVKKHHIIEYEKSGALKSKLGFFKVAAIRKTKKMQRQNCERICFQLPLQLKLPFPRFPLPLFSSLSQPSRNQDLSPPHSHMQNLPRHESHISHLNLGLNFNLYYS